jgi:hypothetical protein
MTNPAIDALVFGLLSAVSLPVGAIMGVYFSPVNPYVVSLAIAFGAGCLMFAVTIELYGVQLEHIESHAADGKMRGHLEFAVTVFFAIVGGLGYIFLNRWMEAGGEEEEEPAEETKPLTTPKLSEEQKGERAKLNWKVGTALASRERRDYMKEHRRILGEIGFERIGTRKTGGEKAKDASAIAFSMFIGILADGVPESILIGFLASEGKLSIGFVIAIFIANFPESFSSGSLLSGKEGFTSAKIVALWTFPFLMTGLFAALAAWLVPPKMTSSEEIKMFSAAIEGVASGMMLAMVGSVMLPEAYQMAHNEKGHGDFPGFMCVVGFLFSVTLKVLGGAIHFHLHGAPVEMEAGGMHNAPGHAFLSILH